MNISGLLEELDIEILRLIAINTSPKKLEKNDKLYPILKRIEISYNSLKEKSAQLDNQLGFFDRMKFKKELQDLLKTVQRGNSGDELKILEVNGKLSKLCAKYKSNPIYGEEKKANIEQSIESKEESSFNPGLSGRIEKAYKAAQENRAVRGVVSDSQVTVLDIEEIRAAAERAKKIETAILKKQELKKEEKDRAARISRAIDRKRAEQRKKSISSQEEARYESIMTKKIDEIMKCSYDKLDSKENVSIRYELQNDTYYLNGEPALIKPKKLISLADKEAYIKSMLRNKSEFKYLVDKSNPEEKKALKNCDPYILGILISKDIRLAMEYMKQIAGVTFKKLSPLGIDVTYDLRGLESTCGRGLSFKERRNIRKTAKQLKRATNVIEDKKKLPWYATIPVIGALAIGGIAGMTASLNGSNQNNDSDKLPENSYSDTLEPGASTDRITNTDTETTYKTTTTAVTTQETTLTTAPNKDEIMSENKDDSGSKDDIETDENEESVVINIGDKISVQDGIKYTANCLGGGNSNRIGAVSWRPASEYNIDRVAFVYQGRVLKYMNAGDQDVAKALNDVADKNGINAGDITTSVLLSLVPGIADTGWANISIDEMQNSLSKPAEEQSNIISHVDFDFDR